MAVRHFLDHTVGAVAGNVKVVNRRNLLTWLQALEYVEGLNMLRRAQAFFHLVNIVPGPLGLFRRDAVLEVGGYPTDTFAEDCDLTLLLLERGWKVRYEPRAASWTEAPENLTAFIKQRYRWTRGMLQAFRKRNALLVTRGADFQARLTLLYMMLEAVTWPSANIAANLFFVGVALGFGFSRLLILWWLQLTLLDVVSALFCIALEDEDIRLLAVAHRRLGRGRAVWLDFEPVAVVPPSRATAQRLLRNAVFWAGRRPLAQADLWPGGARVAALFALDTEDQFQNALLAAQILRELDVPLTFFCVSDLARRHSATLARLAQAGEIASHTDDHTVLAGLPQAAQRRHLAASAAALEELSGQRIAGFRPPEERVDGHTFAAAVQAGFEYVAGYTEKDRAEPIVASGGLVVLPRIPRDDYDLLVKHGLATEPALIQAVARDLAQLRRSGGLYFFSFHTQNMDHPALRTALRYLLEATSGSDTWRAPARTIASWWRERAGVSVRAELVTGARARLRVTARRAVRSIGVTVYLPRHTARLSVSAELGPRPSEVEVGKGADPAAHLRFANLRAGETRVLYLDFPQRRKSTAR